VLWYALAFCAILVVGVAGPLLIEGWLGVLAAILVGTPIAVALVGKGLAQRR
jgi:hypothetical protein